MPSISELLITLALIVAIGVASRWFGKGGRGLKASAQTVKPADSLRQNPKTGVYELVPDDGTDAP